MMSGRRGNAALHTYTERFDGVSLGELLVSEQEMEEATAALTAEQLDIIQEAAKNIRIVSRETNSKFMVYD